MTFMDVRRPACCRCSRAVSGSWRASLVHVERRERRSGRAPFVSIMQPTDLQDRHDGAIAGRRDQTRNRGVFGQRRVRAGPFVKMDYTFDGGKRFLGRLICEGETDEV